MYSDKLIQTLSDMVNIFSRQVKIQEQKIQELEAEIARLRQALVDVSEWWIDDRDPAALALGALNGGKNAKAGE